MQQNQFKHNRFSSSSSKSIANKKTIEILSPNSFPPLSCASQSNNSINTSDSYLTKVRKVATPVNKEIILPGFVKIKFPHNQNNLNKLVYTYGSENISSSITNFNHEIDANAAFNTLIKLHEKRKSLYSDMWGVDACEKEFPPYYSYNSDNDTNSIESMYDSSDEI